LVTSYYGILKVPNLVSCTFGLHAPPFCEPPLLWLVRWISLFWLVYHLYRVGNKMFITISIFQLWMLPQHLYIQWYKQ